MKKFLLFIIIFLNLFLSGCFYSYRDLDKLLFVTSILIDVKNDGSPVLYFETFKAVRTTKKEAKEGRRIYYKYEKKTIAEALEAINNDSSSRVTLSHNKIILITKKAAQYGIENLLDIFDRRQSSNIRTLICIYEGNPDEFSSFEPKEEMMSGLFLFDLIKNSNDVTSTGIHINLKEFFSQRLIGDKVSALPIITLYHINGEKRFSVIGLGLIKDYAMIGTLYDDQTLYFNLLLKNTNTGILKVPNPLQKNKIVTLEILNYSIKSSLNFDGQTLFYKNKLYINTNFTEAQGVMSFNKDVLNIIKDETEHKVKEECLKLFNEYKGKGIDIFDIQEKFNRKYPKHKELNIIKKTELNIDVDVNIEGTTDTFDF